MTRAPDERGWSRDGQLRDAWGDWIAPRAWDHFATLTFGDDVRPSTARQRLERWVRWLEQRAGRRVRRFWVLAPGAAGRLHIHALLEAGRRLRARDIKAAWQRFGLADVARYDGSKGAAYYIAEHLRYAADYGVSTELPAVVAERIGEP